MGYIPNELSADEAENLYMQGELTADEARHLSGNSYDPNRRRHFCSYNMQGQKGYWDDDDKWVSVRDDD